MQFLMRAQGEALRARENYDAQGAREKALFFLKFAPTQAKKAHFYVKLGVGGTKVCLQILVGTPSNENVMYTNVENDKSMHFS